MALQLPWYLRLISSSWDGYSYGFLAVGVVTQMYSFPSVVSGHKPLPSLQIIPVEGDFKYNDEPQSSLKEVQPETVVSM